MPITHQHGCARFPQSSSCGECGSRSTTARSSTAGVEVAWREDKGSCCVGGMWAWLARVASCSDGEGQFGEGRREPMVPGDVHPEFVVSAAEVLDERVP